MRTYEPIWIQLKSAGKVRIAAPPALHKRIIKAVTKEKWLDMGWKLELDEAGRKLPTLEYKREDKFIVFTLKQPIDVDLF